MSIRLDKDLVLLLFCCFWQARRSVHRGHASSWSGLREYYRGERTRIVQQLLRRLEEALPPKQVHQHPQTAEVAMRRVLVPGLRHVLFGLLFNRWKTSWRFPVPELRFMVFALSRFLEALDSPAKPDADTLIALRMNLNACAWPIEARCYALPELKRARRIEHFDRTEWVPHLQLWQILDQSPPHQPSGPAAKAAG